MPFGHILVFSVYQMTVGYCVSGGFSQRCCGFFIVSLLAHSGTSTYMHRQTKYLNYVMIQ